MQTAAKALFILVNETKPRCGLKRRSVILQACLLAHPQFLACANQHFPRQRLSTFLGNADAVPGTAPNRLFGCDGTVLGCRG